MHAKEAGKCKIISITIFFIQDNIMHSAFKTAFNDQVEKKPRWIQKGYNNFATLLSSVQQGDIYVVEKNMMHMKKKVKWKSKTRECRASIS